MRKNSFIDILWASKRQDIGRQHNSTASTGPDKPSQPFKLFHIPPPERLKALTDRTNRACCFYGLIGQDAVIGQLSALLVEAFDSKYHLASAALLFTGNASSGKTHLAKTLARGLELPFVETDQNQITGTQSILSLGAAAAEEAKLGLVELGKKNGKTLLCLPPMVFFIDEIHALRKDIVTAMLKAFESRDRMLVTPEAYVDVSKVLFIGATTHIGEILKKSEAFVSRFQKIDFLSFTLDEVARIVKLNYPTWSLEECTALARRSGCISREAIDMGKQVNRQMRYAEVQHGKGGTRLDAVAIVGAQMQIDELGMSKKQLAVLRQLAQRPKGMTYGQMATAANCGEEQLRRKILPSLLIDNGEQEARVITTHRTFIREAGMKELFNRELVTEKDIEAFRNAA